MRLHHSRLSLFPFFLVLYEIGTYLSNDMYLPALPQMMRDLHLTMQQAQMTLTTWFIGAASMPLIMGMISDRFGRRPVLIGGGYIYVLATLICAITSHYSWMLVGRVIQGCMLASMSVAGYACIHESYEKIEAIKLLALMGSISILAPTIGPLIGGIFMLIMGWRFIFYFIGVWSFISVILLTKWMPETLPMEKRVTLHPLVLFRQYFQVLMNREFTLQSLVMGMFFGGFIMWITAGPLLLIETYHFSPIAFGFVQAGVFAAYMLGNYLAKMLVESLGVEKLIWFGLVVSLVGSIGMSLTGMVKYDLSVFIVAMTVYSFGSGLCFAPISRSIIESSNAPMGLRVALSNVIMIGFGAVGSVIVAVYFNGHVTSLAYPIGMLGVVSIMLYQVILLLR